MSETSDKRQQRRTMSEEENSEGYCTDEKIDDGFSCHHVSVQCALAVEGGSEGGRLKRGGEERGGEEERRGGAKRRRPRCVEGAWLSVRERARE